MRIGADHPGHLSEPPLPLSQKFFCGRGFCRFMGVASVGASVFPHTGCDPKRISHAKPPCSSKPTVSRSIPIRAKRSRAAAQTSQQSAFRAA